MYDVDRVGDGCLVIEGEDVSAIYSIFFKKNFPTKNLQVIHK